MAYSFDPIFADVRAAIYVKILDWWQHSQEPSITLGPLVDDIMLLINDPRLKDRGPLTK